MPYRKITVRVLAPLAQQYRDAAAKLGWRLGDMLRLFICMGAVFYFLSENKPNRIDAVSMLLGGFQLMSFSYGFGFGRHPDRVHGHESATLALSLPESVCDLVAIYADFKHVSRNQAYHRFLHQGQIIYLSAQASILETTRKDSSNRHK